MLMQQASTGAIRWASSWSSDAQGELRELPLPNVPQPNAATALAALRASGLKVSEEVIAR